MLSDNDIQRIVEFHQETFTDCWRNAFIDYATKYAETRHIHSPLARACILRDHCIDHVQRSFQDNPHVECRKQSNGLFAVIMSGAPIGVDGSVAARLKKLNEKMLASNISTKQAIAFDRQMPVFAIFEQMELFGERLVIPRPEPAHVNIGYLPDEFWLMFEGVYATLPNGKRSIKWFVNISNTKSSKAAPIIEMQVDPKPDAQKRVRAKPQTIKAVRTN